LVEAFQHKASNVVFHVGAVLYLGGPAIIVYQIVHWLRFGDWFPIPVRLGFIFTGVATPEMGWVGAQKILEYFLDAPASISVFAVGNLLCAVGVTLQQDS